MKISTRIRFSSSIAALLLAACGGGGGDVAGDGSRSVALHARRTFTSVVSFGDSLSDAGTYAPATVIAGSNPPIYLGGKFTTNSATGTIWVENIAARLGLVITPAEVGFGGRSVRCPAAALGLAASCTAYGQGGSRVTDPNGTRHDAGALTVPVRTQIANHLAAFQSFSANDLILLWAGANDLLWEMEPDPAKNPNSFVVRLFTIQAQAQAGVITADQGNALLADAQLASLSAMKTAALELAADVRTQIIAKGGKHVVVLNLADGAITPEGRAISAQSPILGAALTAFTDAFNQGLKEGLASQPAKLIDIRRLINDVVARPNTHRMANVTVPACDADKMSRITGGAVTDGFALFCNATPDVPYNGIRDGADVNTWFFADGNHPTTGGHKVISDAVIRKLKSFEWLRDHEEAELE